MCQEGISRSSYPCVEFNNGYQYCIAYGMSSIDDDQDGFWETYWCGSDCIGFGNEGAGIVYRDYDAPTAIIRFDSDASNNSVAYTYLRNFLGQTGLYNVAGYNCRDFATEKYNYIVNNLIW